jgi:hypothetical protein
VAPGAATASSTPAPLEAGDLECEDQEDHDKRDNDIINGPPSPDYNKILFAPDDCNAFVDKAAHDDALSLLKTALQEKERDAKREYDARKAADPKDPELGAELFGNMPGKARRMPEGLREFRIELIPGALPVRQGMRRFSADETAEIRRQIDKMLRADVIEACHSPFASGVVLARKKDGSYRFAVDLRKLNQITAENGDDVWLLPRIDECLRRCAGMTWFTCIDARSAFWSIPLARASRRYTAFSTPVGSYFWNVMPMGGTLRARFFPTSSRILSDPPGPEPRDQGRGLHGPGVGFGLYGRHHGTDQPNVPASHRGAVPLPGPHYLSWLHA